MLEHSVYQGQRKQCEHCHLLFDYRENPNWKNLPEGMPESLLSKLRWLAVPHPECEAKLATERFNSKKANEKAREKERIEGILREYGFPKTFLFRTFENFRIEPGTQLAREKLICWNHDKKGVLLYGPPGVGKSHLMAAFVNKWSEAGVAAIFQNVSELMEVLRQGYDDGTYHHRLSLLTSPSIRILVLDDLGAEQPKEWVREKLYQIVDSRIRSELPLFVTTNCTPEELDRGFHPRFVSRLKEACLWIQTSGRDHRG